MGTTFASPCTRLMASLAALNSCCPPSQFCGGAWKRWETSERSKASRRDERVTHVGGADVGARGGAGAGRGGGQTRTLQYVTTYSSFAPVGPEAVAPMPMPTRGSMCASTVTRGAFFIRGPPRLRSGSEVAKKVSARPRRHLDNRRRRDLNETSGKLTQLFPRREV